MYVVHADCLDEAYVEGLRLLYEYGVYRPSRAGEVLVADCPVTTRYEHPLKRVLFNARRNANPFFHLWESLWMLAGRSDATFLDLFVKDFSARFAESNGDQHGAYGRRWRSHFSIYHPLAQHDQLKAVIEQLKADPNDRRVVIQMWDPEYDLGRDMKDVPCNLSILPRIRHDNKLDITVFCRSNDAIWGAYGANAVHFSFLQEYLAAMIGCGVGTYYQISNNFHAYSKVLQKLCPPEELLPDEKIPDPYQTQKLIVDTLVTDPECFDIELKSCLEDVINGLVHKNYKNKFLSEVALPMYRAAKLISVNELDRAADELMFMPTLNDWKSAAGDWLMRRRAKLAARRRYAAIKTDVPG